MTMEFLHVPLTRDETAWMHAQVKSWLAGRIADEPVWQASFRAELIVQVAELHGVLPIVLRALQRVEGADEAVLAQAQQKRILWVGREMQLRQLAREVGSEIEKAGLRALVVKGPTNADTIYAVAADRPFSDIDFLVPQEDRDAISDLLRKLGFEHIESEYRQGEDYCEDQWYTSGRQLGFEVHSNLVHNPRLRKGMSLSFADVVTAGLGEASDPEALVMVNAVHAVASHQFDRLQHLVDIALSARLVIDEDQIARLVAASRRCGADSAVCVGLLIAGRMMNEAHCIHLATRFGRVRKEKFTAFVLSNKAILQARSSIRGHHSWRRKLLRHMLKT